MFKSRKENFTFKCDYCGEEFENNEVEVSNNFGLFHKACEVEGKQEEFKRDSILKLLTELKSSLGEYRTLTLEEYDTLYGDIEEIQYTVLEAFND